MKNTFDNLYIYFSESYLSVARTIEECSLIERLCDLKPGDSILDVGCGHGRISNELARRGYNVTGVDWSVEALKLAVAKSEEQGLSVKYENANFLNFKALENYELVLSWYTSFGYTDDKSSRTLLRQLNAALKPGGAILIDHINRDRCLKNLPKYSVEECESNYMIDAFDYEVLTGVLNIDRRFVKNGSTILAPYSIRLLSYTELKDWLSYAGFSDVYGFDGHGASLALDSSRMIVRGVKTS
jgi:SAM-dependent methyltransferase